MREDSLFIKSVPGVTAQVSHFISLFSKEDKNFVLWRLVLCCSIFAKGATPSNDIYKVLLGLI